MRAPLLTELPYRADSTALFEAIADAPWAVFLDSGLRHPGQSRYDILAAQPYVRLVTRGPLTEIPLRLMVSTCSAHGSTSVTS